MRTRTLQSSGLVFAALTLLPACSGTSPAGGPSNAVVLVEGEIIVTYRPGDGTFDIARGSTPVFLHAAADALIDDGSGPRRVSFTDTCARRQEGPSTFVCDAGGLVLRLHFDLPPGRLHLTVDLELVNGLAKPITALSLAPLALDADHGGALLLGPTPSRHRILENGRYDVFDQTAQLELGDTPPFQLGFALPIPVRGSSVSNWSHVVADADDPSMSLVAGWLSADLAIPTLGIAFDSLTPPKPIGGRTPFTTYAAESTLLFHGKRLAPADSVKSELLYLDPLPQDPLERLERFADTLAAHHGITPWPKRGPGHEVPAGWNSWTGGGAGIGGYGQDIDQALITANMAVFKRELQPFGANYFQVDDGWQKSSGDWQWKPDTFPKGGAAEAAEIAAAGFKPGLWLAPFAASKGSALAAAHPDWLQPQEDGLIGKIVGKDRETIDPSNPAVRAYLHDLFAGIKADGWKWAKGDFSYLALLGKLQHDPSLTAVEAWRGGWKEIRDALGPDVFLLGIGVMGPNVGLLDSMRLTLDNGPKWDEASADDTLSTPRAFKATVRTGSRRWFYQNRVWVSHDDLIFFRSWPPDANNVPPLSLEESRTFATWIALGGGVVELGDKLLDMASHPEWIDIVRRLLPVWPQAARPLDVLRRDYPEEFRERIEARAGEWDIVGLLNWGTNRDWTVDPPAALPDAERTYTVHCDGECLVYEFWSGEYLGRKLGDFEVKVGARRAKVLSLRKPADVPSFLGTNRHVTQGATDMGALTWDGASRTLSGTLDGCVGTKTAPWAYALAFQAPAGFTLSHAEVDGVAAPSATQDGDVVRLAFSLPAASQGKVVGFRVTF